MKLLRTFFVLSICLIGINCLAQDKWTIITKKPNGLPSNYVINIAFDKNNIAWLAGDSGLVRYDGDLWLVYNKKNVGFRQDYITSVNVDANNVKWIGSNPSLYWYNDTVWKKDSAYYDNIQEVLFNEKNDGWVCTTYSGLVYNNRSTTLHKPTLYPPNKFEVPYFSNFAKDKDGNIWCVSSNGQKRILYKIVDSVWKFGADTSRSFMDDYRLAFDKNNILWMISLNHGLYKFDGTKWTNYNIYNSDIQSQFLSDIAIDKNNNLWIAADDALIYYNQKEFKIFNKNNSPLPEFTHASCIKIDSLGRKWIGSYSKGLFIYSGDGSEIPYTDIKGIHKIPYSLYPNPTSGILHFESFGEEITISILDMTGKFVFSKTFKNFGADIDISDIPDGIYLVKMSNVNGDLIKAEKIIKIH